MSEHEYKYWCGNCQIRIYVQRHYGRMLTWHDCPYTCEYATAMRCSITKEKSDERLPSAQPTIDVHERNVGKWTEMTVIHKDEAKDIIEEWQSCRCSVCGRYDTRPYMYYFDKPNFCSWCGADMRERREDAE